MRTSLRPRVVAALAAALLCGTLHVAPASSAEPAPVTVAADGISEVSFPTTTPEQVAGTVREGLAVDWVAQVPADAPERRITRVRAYFRGTLLTDTGTVSVASTTGSLVVEPGHPLLIVGRHQVRVLVNTSDGRSSSDYLYIYVSDGTTFPNPVYQKWGVEMSADADHWVTAGTTVGFYTYTRAAAWGLPVSAADVLVDGVSVNDTPGQCVTTAPCGSGVSIYGTWKAPATPGSRHEVEFVSAVTDGEPARSVTRTVRVQPATSAVLDEPAVRVPVGAKVKVSGTFYRTDNSKPVSGLPVELQYHHRLENTWTTVATGTTDSRGKFTGTGTPPVNGAYRLYTPGVTGTAGPVYSAGMSVSARPRVTLVTSKKQVTIPKDRRVRRSATARARRTVTFTVTSSRYQPGTRVQLQVWNGYSSWETLRSAELPASRVVKFRVRLNKRGKYKFGAVTSRTTAYDPGVSGNRRVTAHRR